jgi:hypothetical protein
MVVVQPGNRSATLLMDLGGGGNPHSCYRYRLQRRDRWPHCRARMVILLNWPPLSVTRTRAQNVIKVSVETVHHLLSFCGIQSVANLCPVQQHSPVEPDLVT